MVRKTLGRLADVSRKSCHALRAVTSPNVDRFSTLFSCRLASKFATKSSSKIPPSLKNLATLPCNISGTFLANSVRRAFVFVPHCITVSCGFFPDLHRPAGCPSKFVAGFRGRSEAQPNWRQSLHLTFACSRVAKRTVPQIRP